MGQIEGVLAYINIQLSARNGAHEYSIFYRWKEHLSFVFTDAGKRDWSLTSPLKPHARKHYFNMKRLAIDCAKQYIVCNNRR